ncbi:MAG: FAD-dependent monooxygenase [Pelagibacterales bacterium]|nr:FAD-dependent monooxygenase [Pelagibacterales bacterium]
MKKIAIIGAGISGLFIANLLRQDSNYDITIYEKNNFINLEKGYGIQLSVNSVKLLNKIGFQNIDQLNKFNPNKIDFYSLQKKQKICDLNISEFNTDNAKYTTLQRSTLIEFLKEKIPTNLIQYNKKIKQVDNKNETVKLTFEKNSSAEYDYLVISDGVFSPTKSLVANKQIEPQYFTSIAIRGTINRKNFENISYNNISLFLGSNFHSVVYPVDKNSEFNFIGILRKNLTNNQLQNYSLFSENSFISSILSELSGQIDQNILENINNIKCFPIFISNEIYDQQHKNIFLIGDAFFAFPPSFAQGASQSIEAAFELFEYINKNSNDFNKRRIEKTKMINNRSKFNHFVFHLSNPLIIFVRDFILRNLVKNKKFLENYLGKIYKN